MIPGLHRSLPILRQVHCSTKIVGVRHASSVSIRVVTIQWESWRAWFKPDGHQVNLAGVFPPIVTPFNPDESIAWDKLRGNLAKWVIIVKSRVEKAREQSSQSPWSDMRKKVAGGGRSPWVGSWCTAATGSLPISAPRRGSMWSGSSRRRWCVCSVEPSTVLQAGAGQLVLAGSGCESTRETIEMTSAMAGRIKIKTSREEKRIRRRMWIRSNLCVFCTSTSCICWICLSAPLRALYIQTMHISYFHSAHITLS